MNKIQLFIISTLLLFGAQSASAKCDCNGNEVITVCQNGKTKRVNCNAQSDPNVYCGPCNTKPDCTPGAPCSDGNDCTKWDKYDNNCNCIGKLADEDNDGVCDAVDTCPDGDDLKDENKNGMPDDCEGRPDPSCSDCPVDSEGLITICWINHSGTKMQGVKASCEWLGNFFHDNGTLKGKSKCGPCDCAYMGQKDSDSDGICDDKDKCPNDPENKCNDTPPVDSNCDNPCRPQGDTEYEWIQKISMNQLENESGDNGGYADFTNMVLELGQGDSLSLWVFPELLQAGCEVSISGYIDWNNDCDFDDAGELIFDNRTNGENGADIAVPKDATPGDLKVRFIVHNGRLKSSCQECIDGEVEDYTLRVFNRAGIKKPISTSKHTEIGKKLEVFPNPIFENQSYVLKVGDQIVDISQVTIYNASGQLVETKNLQSGERIYNPTQLQAGLYIFELNNELGSFKEIVIVTK